MFLFLTLSCNLIYAKRPNFIFIVADDLNDSIGVMGGHPQAKTPSIDALANAGAMFENAQVNSPICGPSRASFLTGLAPHTTGYYGFNFIEDHWRDNPTLKYSVTIPEHLRAHGYKILITGKIYHNNQEDVTLWYEQGIPPSWGPWPWDGRRQSGFEHGSLSPWRNTLPHPSMPEGIGIDNSFASLSDIPQYLKDETNGVPGYRGWRLFFAPFRYVSETERDLMPDELNARWVKSQLQKKHSKPFMMMVGFNRPHTPMYVPQTYLDKFPLDEIQVVQPDFDDLDDIARGFKPDHASFHTKEYGYYKYRQITSHGDKTLKAWIQAYLASVNFIDAQLEMIVDALEQSDYANNTYIIFTSDHGYHLGEKQMLFKNTPWEKSARVPLIVYGPDIQSGQKIVQPVSLVDLYPSINDWANLPNDPNIGTNGVELDGNSIRPLLERGFGNWQGRSVALTSVASDKKLKPAQPGRATDQHHSVRSSRYRYILTAGGEEELYDHDADPHEWINLADDKQYTQTKKALRRELLEIIRQ